MSNWITVLPAFRVPRGTAVIDDLGVRGVVIQVMESNGACFVVAYDTRTQPTGLMTSRLFPWPDLRVDLDESAGFAFALRRMVIHVRTNGGTVPEFIWSHRMKEEEKNGQRCDVALDKVDREEIREAAWSQWEKWMTQAWAYDAITEEDKMQVARALSELRE